MVDFTTVTHSVNIASMRENLLKYKSITLNACINTGFVLTTNIGMNRWKEA